MNPNCAPSFYLDRGSKIQSIKKMCEVSGLGLKEAKDVIDDLFTNTAGEVYVVVVSSCLPEKKTEPNFNQVWNVVIRDEYDSYTEDTVKFTGSEFGANDEALYYAGKNPGNKVYLYKAVTMTVVPKNPAPVITKL